MTDTKLVEEPLEEITVPIQFILTPVYDSVVNDLGDPYYTRVESSPLPKLVRKPRKKIVDPNVI